VVERPWPYRYRKPPPPVESEDERCDRILKDEILRLRLEKARQEGKLEAMLFVKRLLELEIANG